MTLQNSLLETFTLEQKTEAHQLRIQIEEEADSIRENKRNLETSYVRIGAFINLYLKKKYWLLGDYKSAGDYMKTCEEKFGIGHSQLYLSRSVAENLGSKVSEDNLYDMGITKAAELSKYVQQSGGGVPTELLSIALDKNKKTDELKSAANLKLHNIVSEDKGKWYDLGGFYATQEEILELEQALEKAANADPIISKELPEWIRKKMSILRLSQEFSGSY